jgi:hypothetical protein
MRFIRHFDYADQVLAIEDDLSRFRQVTRAALPHDAVLDEGFFVDSPQFVFVVGTPRGPALYAGGKTVLLAPGSRLDLVGAGPDRELNVASACGVTLQFPAPEPGAVDVDDPDDRERIDFYLWLCNRILLPYVQARYRT